MDRSPVTATGAGATASPFAHATLVVGSVETAYRRVGSGAPVVLLGLSGEDEAAIMSRLSQPDVRRRVIVPDCSTLAPLAPLATPEESAFACWLTGFLHGLGLERPRLLASAGFREELERYAQLRPDELGPVVIVGAGASADAIALLLSGNGGDHA